MKKSPWKTILIGSTVMTVLVLARCIATACMELYYGRTDWINKILQDPWLYVGAAAVLLVYISALASLIQNHKKRA